MATARLSSDEFFTQLASLIQKTQQKGHGGVHMTQKRMTYDESSASSTTAKVQDDPLWDLHPPNPLPLIIRASDGKTRDKDDHTKKIKKTKISTIVQPDDIEAFFARYAEVCKAGMQSLKKRDRTKRKKDKKKKGKGGEEKKG